MKQVYLDYAATSPLKKEVFNAMKPYLMEKYGNASSIHKWGREARQAIDDSRSIIAKFFGCEANEIIFTSGGTEADNLAITGVIARNSKHAFRHAFRNSKQIINSKFQNKKPHIITSEIEHHAIINTCKALEKEGLAEVTYLKPDRNGIISIEKVKKAIKKNTILVSIMYVNNEVGTVQPIREIGKMIEKENKIRNTKTFEKYEKLYFHSDAVQATEYQNMNVDYLHVDMLSISAHKIGGPKGTGVLYVKKGTPLNKILFGGEQELNMRAGTENVAGIVGIGRAIELLGKEKCEMRVRKTQKLRDYFIDKIQKEISKVELNGDKLKRSPNNINFYFSGIEGESILLNLDLVGIAASSGSACTSQSLSPSHVLLALYDNPERAHSSIRFTLGPNTSKEYIDYTVKNLIEIVKKLRKMSPLYKGEI